MTRLGVVLLLGLLSGGSVVPLPQATESLDEAKRLYNEGRFGQAVARVQSVLLKLEGDPTVEARSLREEAYLYFGLSYIALDDPEAARAAFRALLRTSPGRRLDARVYAPKVVEAFEAARQELGDSAQADVGGGTESPPKVTTTTPSTSERAASPNAPRRSKAPSRVKWTLVGAGAAGGAVAAVDVFTEPTATTTVPAETVEVDLRVNGLKRGTFSCAQEFAFTVDVINGTNQIVRVQGFDINLMSATSSCVSHRAELDGTVNLDLQPGSRVQVRRVDLQGELCVGPGRTPGCDWRSVIVVMTSVGNFQGEAQFSTVR